MVPIHELLHRIKWDKEFGKGRFEVGYLDRVAGGIIKIPFTAIEFPEGDHFSIKIADGWEEPVSIPFHRIRKVWKNGLVIWERK